MHVKDIFLIFGLADILFSLLLYIYIYDKKNNVKAIRSISNSRIFAGLGLLIQGLKENFLTFFHNDYSQQVFSITANTIICFAIFITVNAFKECLSFKTISFTSKRNIFLLIFVSWAVIFFSGALPGIRVAIFSIYYFFMSLIIFKDLLKNWKTNSLLQKSLTVLEIYYLVFTVFQLVWAYHHPHLTIANNDGVNIHVLLLGFFVNYIMFFGFLLLSKEITDNELIVKATTDYLTGLLNRQAFFDIAEKIFSLQLRKKASLSLLYIDIDFFKSINDNYGHLTGDYLLISFSKKLSQSMRKSDFIVRLGGEEFAVLMFDTSPTMASEVAERFRKEIEEYTFSYLNYTALKMTTSIGVYGESVVSSDKFEQFIHLADEALYRAKKTGRNKVVLYN